MKPLEKAVQSTWNGHGAFVFGHRGAMGYEIENTITSFKKAGEMGAGIETDLHLTKDNILVCFHDLAFRIDSRWYTIKNLLLKELQQVKFEDNRDIPTAEELFQMFDAHDNLRFSVDVGNKRVGIQLIDLIKEFPLLDQVEITDTRLRLLAQLREHDKDVKLVYTIPYEIPKINNKTIDFEKIHQLDVHAVNIKNERATEENFQNIIDNGLKCYCWGVNAKSRMRKVLNLNYND